MLASAATDLSMFFEPESVAVVGASEDVSKWGYWLASGALSGAHRRRVELVNRRGRSVLGHETRPSLGDLDEAVELVVLAIPAAAVDEVVDEALEMGTRGFLAVTAGLQDETGLAARVRAGGARLIGPNCLGVHDSANELALAPWGRFAPGSIAIVSQSGQLGLEIAALVHEAGLGVSRFVSVGNQTDVTAQELLSDLVAHPQTEVVALYLESFGDGRSLARTLAELRAVGKPTVLMTIGSSGASRQAALSHTGALTSPVDVVDAACRAAGAVRVATPSQLADAAQILLRAPRPKGRRVALIGDSGGQGALAADIATQADLDVVALPEDVRAALRELLPRHAATHNPIDLAGAGEQEMATYARGVSIVASCDKVDSVVLTGYFGRYGDDSPSLACAEIDVVSQIGEVVASSGKPVVAHTMATASPALRALAAAGVPTYHTVERALQALSVDVRLAATAGRDIAELAPAPADGVGTGYFSARKIGESAGIRFPAAALVSDERGLRAAADRLRAPYVLKADWLAHKSEHGAVVHDLVDVEAVVAAFRDLVARLGRGAYVLEETDRRAGVLELIVGARRDPSFGPLVLVGSGGTRAELDADVVLELAPVNLAIATGMIERLRSYPMLAGWRGQPPVHTGALAEVVVAVGQLISSRRDISDFELNPVRVASDGAIAVDALATSAQP